MPNDSLTDDFDLGARLKQLRMIAGISQRALAARAEMPGGHVSMIENGKSNPSVQTLRKLAAALGITMSEFFEPDPGLPQKVFFKTDDPSVDQKSILTTDGGRITAQQIGETRFLGMEFQKRAYKAGADSGQLNGADVAEAGFVTSGVLDVTIGGQTEQLRAGDAYFVPSFTPYQFRNTGENLVEVISTRPAVEN